MTTNDPVSTEWEKTWGKVIQNPEDFSSWETLVKLAESVKGGLSKTSGDQDKSNLRTVYDHFLSKFPLCFGYWKKYADWELILSGPVECQAVNFFFFKKNTLFIAFSFFLDL
jgi:pre-mRNA-processing factor 39